MHRSAPSFAGQPAQVAEGKAGGTKVACPQVPAVYRLWWYQDTDQHGQWCHSLAYQLGTGGTPATHFRSSSGMPVSVIKVTNVFVQLLNGLEMPHHVTFAR